MSLSVLADENIPAVEDCLGAFASVRRTNGRTLDRAQLDDVDILLVRSVTRVDETLLRDSAVKFVGTATSGFDHIDRDYLARNGIGFAHAPGSNANSVVEYVLAAIAAVDDKLEQLLAGGNVGIVGYGIIGKAVAARFAAQGIQCRIYDPWLEQNTIPNAAELHAVLDCDVVSLHAQLTQEQPWPSHHLLGSPELQRLRAGTLLINASRGPVVDNATLLQHLEATPGRPTVLDVWEGEPAISAALLAQVTLGTAHIAGYSLDGKLQATRLLSEAVISHLRLPPLSQASQVEGVPVISAPDNVSTAALLRVLIQTRYDIFLDDTLLREAVAGEQSQPVSGAGFDLLRKSYRNRRELAGSKVEGLCLPEHIALARALGCVPVNTDPIV
jgi:erythronate-4-phosphate dehydrogenase